MKSIERKILFVCTGNTCRSPIAEALWRALGHDDVASAGVSAWPGLPAATHARQAVKQYGASLESHRSRDLRDIDSAFDLVLTMTRDQYTRLLEFRPQWADRTFLLTEMVGESGDVGDPFGQDFEAYHAVAEEIRRLLCKLEEKLTKGS